MLNSWVGLSKKETPKVKKSQKAVKSPFSGHLILLGPSESTSLKGLIKKYSLSWQKEDLLKQSADRELFYFHSPKDGPFWILRPLKRPLKQALVKSDYAWYRDTVGGLVTHFKAHRLTELKVSFQNIEKGDQFAALIGLELAAYNFKNDFFNLKFSDLPQLIFDPKTFLTTEQRTQAVLQAQSVNMARHLVNMPPNVLNPETFLQWIQKIPFQKNIEIEVWDAHRLAQENMNLFLAVGQGAAHAPRMVRIKYRPPSKKKEIPIVAFVGKGITFDSGGLDLKPSSAMRLMKKDMGGAAAVCGLAYFVSFSEYQSPCDFYIALAENSVDAKSFRPSDVFVARNGRSVEIDNTDAEGRLVLADTLDVACRDPKTAPVVIDLATLTGAGKVALGADIASLFTNDEILGELLFESGIKAGDLVWKMPLFQKYFSSMSSSFADFKNSGESYGGAITAALFLEKFVADKRWAHLDIYAWNDKAEGALSSVGGSGQSVQCLIEFLKKIEKRGLRDS